MASMSEQMRPHEIDHVIPKSLPIVVRRSTTAIARHVSVLEATARACLTPDRASVLSGKGLAAKSAKGGFRST